MKKILLFLIITISFIGCDKDEPIKPIIQETEYLDENNYAKLTEGSVIVDSYENIKSVTDKEIIITTETEKLHNLQIGNFFVSGKSKNAPNGFIREITGIVKNGNTIKFQTKQAKLVQVYEDLVIETPLTIDYKKFKETYGKSSKKSNSKLNDNKVKVDFKLDPTDRFFEVQVKLSDTITFEGSINILKNNSEAKIDLKRKYFSIEKDFKIEVKNKITYKTEIAKLDKEIRLGEIPIATIPVVKLGIVINVNLEFFLTLEGKIQSTIGLKNSKEFIVASHIIWDKGKWLKGNNSKITSNTDAIFQTELDASIGLSTGLNFKLYNSDNAKTGIYMNPYFWLNIKKEIFYPEFLWSYGYGGKINAKAKLELLGINIVDFDEDIHTFPRTTLKQYPETPIVLISKVSNIKETSIQVDSRVENETMETIVKKGVCWSEMPNPTIADFTLEKGNGYGSFTTTPDNLKPDTVYYIRAYAIISNSKTGIDNIIYSEQKEFTTLASNQVPTITTNHITDITQTSAKSGGNITSNGGTTITERGIVWSKNPEPTVNDTKIISNQNSTNTFISIIDGLTPNTKYYLKAYAINSVGITYGEEKEFTTLLENQKPTVSTNNITDITNTSAKSGGNVTSDGGTSITERGIVWSTTANPTTNDNKIIDTQNTTSAFSSVIESLTPNTTYYIRAYATNNVGISYGEQKEFTTDNNMQTEPVHSPTPLNQETNIELSGTLSFTIGNNTPSNAIFKIYLDTNNNPTNEHSLGGATRNYSNLEPNTTYYWKVETLDNNNSGEVIATSQVWSFTTKAITEKIYDGDVSLTTQQEVDDFGEQNFTKILGSFIIGSTTDYNSSIHDLSKLKSLVETGWFGILRNNSLTTLTGLENLTKTKGFYIQKNKSLIDIQSLSNLNDTSPGNFSISENDNLINLTGLNNITTSEIWISNNPNLINIEALKNINYLGNLNGIRIINNDKLTNLSGLEKIVITNQLWIKDNDNLSSLKGIENIIEIKHKFVIDNNINLNDLSAIRNINFTNNMNKEMSLLNTPLIKNLSFLSGINNLSKLEIKNNKLLSNYCGLDISNQTNNINFISSGNLYNPTLQDLKNGNCSN